MSIALSEFWTRLVRSGVTDASGCKTLAAAYTKANRGTPPSDAEGLAHFMVQAGTLTTFQAEALLADQPKELRAGNYLVRSAGAPRPLSRWVDAIRIGDGSTGFLLRATAEQLAGGRMEWLEAHAAVQSETLQPLAFEPQSTSTLVFSALPLGSSLHEVLVERGSLSPRDACEVAIAVADAIEAMHARPLIHGAVRPDRVWMGEDGQVVLLRDPSGPPPAPHEVSSAGWLDAVDSPISYAAPELANEGQGCNQATDIYSLGCLMFRMVSGRNPFDKDSANETMAAHAAETPPELADAMAQGESGDPLYRVIAFAMAKNPAARFATAPQLAGALRATLPLLPQPAKVDERAETVGQIRAKRKTKDPVKKPVKKTKQAVARSRDEPARAPSSKTEAGDQQSNQPPQSRQQPQKASLPPSAPPARRPPEPNDSPPAAKSAKSDRQTESKPPTSKAPAEPAASPPSPARAGAAKASEAAPAGSTVAGSTAAGSTPAGATAARTSQPGSPEPRLATPQDPPPATESEASSDDQAPSRPARRRKKKKNNAPFVLGAMCVAILMLLIALMVTDPNTSVAEKKPRPPIPKVIPPVSNRPVTPVTPDTNGGSSAPAESSAAGYELVSDDRLLFVPPYAADSPNAPLELLPPGPGIILSVRLAAINESSLGTDLMDALQPELGKLIESAVSRSKVPVDSIERCSVAMHPGRDGWPEVSLAIKLKQPELASKLLDQWQVAASRTSEGATIYAGESVGADAFYFAADPGDTVSQFAVGSVARISEVAGMEGGAIPLTRTWQTLWNGSSAEADLALLITPNFLFADGRALLQSSAPELIPPLKRMLQPDVAAALVTAKIRGEQVYVESRFAPSGGISEAALMRAVRESIETWPAWADEFIVDSVPDSSWRLLASRLPSMMRFVVNQMRFGISDGSAVANAYLPAQAIPQVTLGTLLAMNTPSGGTATVAQAEPARSLTIDEMLDRKMSVSFEQESLEFAIDAIVGAFKESLPEGSTMPPVRIVGSDLQLMGITQNQQVRDFAKPNLPLRTILTDLVLGANPDKTATGPQDPKQALIWVVTDDSDNPGNKVILVTTRQAAENKYELPREFQPAT